MNNLSNQVQLIGNLGADVETYEVGNGRKIAKARIATNRSYKNPDGEWTKTTDWHNVVAWGKTANLISEKASKGTQICVRGRLSTRSYDDKDGNKKYVTEVIVHEFRTFHNPVAKPF